jgi:hypothetical protein
VGVSSPQASEDWREFGRPFTGDGWWLFICGSNSIDLLPQMNIVDCTTLGTPAQQWAITLYCRSRPRVVDCHARGFIHSEDRIQRFRIVLMDSYAWITRLLLVCCVMLLKCCSTAGSLVLDQHQGDISFLTM